MVLVAVKVHVLEVVVELVRTRAHLSIAEVNVTHHVAMDAMENQALTVIMLHAITVVVAVLVAEEIVTLVVYLDVILMDVI